MVGPSISGEKRKTGNRVLGVGFVAIVGASSALIAFNGGASLTEVALVGASGLVVGALLLLYLVKVL